MKDDRLRVTLNASYASALGRALFCFARMEWDAIYCCERLSPGYIGKLGITTAGGIANDLIAKARRRRHVWPHIQKPATEFKRLVVVRNELVHGKPGSQSSDAKGQLLFRRGAPWTIEQVNEAAENHGLSPGLQ